MSEFKTGDRVEVIGEPIDGKNLFGEMGKVVAFGGDFDALFDETDLIGVEFDNNILGHDCCGGGKGGHCWWVDRKYLKKVEDTEEETKEEVNEEIKAEALEKAEAMEQKILTALREEIGIDIGEEFDVYENGVKWWTCKFEENGHLARYKKCKFSESFIWKYWIFHFDKYVFKRKPFMPEYGEDYFFLAAEYDENNNIIFRVLHGTWIDNSIDYGMLALGNVFRSEEEALKSKDEMLEKLRKLRKGEQI